jgi:hypothetical protein
MGGVCTATKVSLTPQAEFNEPNGNIKTESRPEDCLFEICGGPVSGGTIYNDFLCVSDMSLGETNTQH